MISRQRRLAPCVILAVLLSVWTEEVREDIGIQLIPQHPEIRGSVALTVTGVSGRVLSSIWYKGANTHIDNVILTYITGDAPQTIPGPKFHNRMEASATGSLMISNLNRTDEGNYTLKITTDIGGEKDGSVYLRIYEKVGKPTITPNTSQPKESDTITLTCISTNAERIAWSRASGHISSEATLSSDNKTLTFRMNRTDTGDYKCEGGNPISKEESDPYKLTVSYGPEIPVINVKKIDQSRILLECSADSVPLPLYQWRLDGRDLNVIEKTLSVKRENEGYYECVVKNSVTQKTANISIFVNATIEATVSAPNNQGLIIGVVIAVLLLIVLVTALVYLFVIRKRRKKLKANSSPKGGNSRNGRATGPAPAQEPPEIQYADIVIKKMPRKQQPPPESLYANRPPPANPAPENVVYSELRIN